MTLEDINYIAQTIGVVAILGSLIAIIAQLRQSAAAAKAAAADEVHRRFSEVYVAMAHSTRQAEVYVKANLDYGSLTPTERFEYTTAAMALWLNTQEAHRKWMEGALDDQRWRLWDGITKSIFSGSASAALWAERRHMFSDAFQAYADAIISAGTAIVPPVWADRTHSETPG